MWGIALNHEMGICQPDPGKPGLIDIPPEPLMLLTKLTTHFSN